jgi:hypothetical protein
MLRQKQAGMSGRTVRALRSESNTENQLCTNRSRHSAPGQPARCSRKWATLDQACVPEMGTTRKVCSNTSRPP